MTLWAVLATGASMGPGVASKVGSRCRTVAVSNAFELAPWADALASFDTAWWRAYPTALKFRGRRFSGTGFTGTETLPDLPRGGINSGLLGMRVAQALGATRIALLGFDMSGSHYFGEHRPPLKNTTPARFARFMEQFEAWDGCEVVNCTPDSALTCFPRAALETVLRG